MIIVVTECMISLCVRCVFSMCAFQLKVVMAAVVGGGVNSSFTSRQTAENLPEDLCRKKDAVKVTRIGP